MNYFSIEFHYVAAPRGFGGKSFHVSLAVNERTESEKLSKAMRKACEAMDKIKLNYWSEYAYPDGSLYYSCRTQLSFADLFFLLRLFFGPIELYVLNEDDTQRYWEEGSPTWKKYMDTTPTSKGMSKQYFRKKVSAHLLPDKYCASWRE